MKAEGPNSRVFGRGGNNSNANNGAFYCNANNGASNSNNNYGTRLEIKVNPEWEVVNNRPTATATRRQRYGRGTRASAILRKRRPEQKKCGILRVALSRKR